MWENPSGSLLGRSTVARLDELPEPPDWVGDALCAQIAPEVFFPDEGGSTREAKKICAACPVRAQCLEYALTNGERFGIWGGLSERERRKLSKQVSVVKKPNVALDEVPRVQERHEAGHTDVEIARRLGLTARQVRLRRLRVSSRS